MLRNGFTRFCDDPEIACCKAEKELEQLRAELTELKALAQAKADGRLVVLPEGYEHAEELYHVVNLPKWCDEDGNGCEDCRHEVCNGDGASIDCTFKPYVSKIGANAVFDALYTLNGLSLSKESAEKALGGKE